MLSIYVYTNGDVAFEFFNAIAAFLGTNDFATLLYISAVFSILGASVMYIRTKNIMALGKWFAIYLTINSLMLGIKVSIEVIDVSNPMAAKAVDNVPIGLALPASIISKIGYALTQDFSDVFHTPDDVSYLSTGMIFGAKLFYTVTQASQIQNAEIRQNMQDFTRQCILPDITIRKKYTMQDLSTSPDIMTFLSDQPMSQIRGIYMGGAFQTCAAALPKIKSAMQTESNSQQTWIERLLNGASTPDPTNLQNQINDIYNKAWGMSQSAQQILAQNMMINAIKQGFATTMATQGSTSAMLNYTETAGLQKQLLSDNTIARTAAYLVPLMQTVFFLICIGVFPIVMAFLLQPALFANMLNHYVSSLIYLSIWPLLFVILDFIMKSALSHYMTGIAIYQGGITLSNQNALLYEVEQFAGYAGYLMMLVPFLAGFIFKGLQNTLISAATTMVGGMQSNLTSVATNTADGNISIGNTNVGNASWNNVSGNKHDLNSTNFKGMSSTQRPDGSVETQSADGHVVINMDATLSHTPISAHRSDSIIASASTQAAYHRSQADSAAQNFGTSISAGSQAMTSLSKSLANSTGHGDSWNITDSSHINEAIHNAATSAHQYAERHSITDQEANQILLQQTAHGEISGSVGAKIFGSGGHVGASLSTDALSQKNAHSTATGDYSDAKDFAINSGYNKDISIIHDATKSHSYHANSEEAASELNSLSAHLDSAKQAGEQWSSQRTEAQNYDKVASMVKSEGAGFNQNLDQQYVEWMAAKQTGTTQVERMQQVESILHNNPQLAGEMASQFAQEQTTQLANQFASQSGHTATGASGISSQVANQLRSSSGKISSTGDNAQAKISAEATMNNLNFGTSMNDQTRHSVESQIADQSQNVASGHDQILTTGETTENSATQRIKDGIKGNIEMSAERSGIKEDKLN